MAKSTDELSKEFDKLAITLVDCGYKGPIANQTELIRVAISKLKLFHSLVLESKSPFVEKLSRE